MLETLVKVSLKQKKMVSTVSHRILNVHVFTQSTVSYLFSEKRI